MNSLVKVDQPTVEHDVAAPLVSGTALYRVSTEAASICKDIVVATAVTIQGRRYVCIEGWMAVALAHGCAASSGDVVRHEDGSVSATGRVIRIDTGRLISSAEGYVGADETTWFGGSVTDKWGKTKILPKRPDYAIRAMAQTRAISRACRSAFAHVVVMMNVGLSTTPAEEMQEEGFERSPPAASAASPTKPFRGTTIDHAQSPAPPLDDAIPERVMSAPAAPKRKTIRDWLAEMSQRLSAAPDMAAVDAILAEPEVERISAGLKNGAASEWQAMLAEAVERVTMAEQEGRPDTGRDTQLPNDGHADFPGDR